MVLRKNQFKDESADSSIIEDLAIIDADIATNANIQQSKIQNLVTDLTNKANKSGDTLTGPLVLNYVIPNDPQALVTKQYVDDNLPQGATTLASLPNWYINTNTVFLSSYFIPSDSGQIQQGSNGSISFNVANIENNTPPSVNTFYYLYATGTDFKFSLSEPINFMHPTNPWIYMGSVKVDGSGNLIKTRKIDNQYKYFIDLPNISDTTAKTPYNLTGIIPPNASYVWIGVLYSESGTSAGNFFLYTDSTSNPVSTFNFQGYNGTQAGYTYNAPIVLIPVVDPSRNIYYSSTGNGSFDIRLYGWAE